MFWSFSSSSTVEVDTALDKESVTLKELLELEDIIQECKNQNKKLVEYLVSGDNLSNLIDYIIHEPPDDVETAMRFRLAHVASELLSCEVPQINEKICNDEQLLDKLYSSLEHSETPLNPLLASFFTKAFGVLITRKSEQNWYSHQFTCLQVFEFLKKKDFVGHILKHIGTSAVSDFVLRLITCVEGTNTKQGLLDWLNETHLIESIIGLLSDRYDRDVHDNASRLLIEILRVSRDGQYVPANERCVDPLLSTLESPSTVELLLNTMFSSQDTPPPAESAEESERQKHVPSESVLVNGISVLLALLENRKAVIFKEDEGAGASSSSSDGAQANLFGPTPTLTGAGESGPDSGLSPEELAEQKTLLDATISAVIPRLKDFTDVLENPPNKTPIKTTAGELDPPLGQARLHISMFVSSLLAMSNQNANQKLIELKTLDKLLDLFFRYSLNNFLHSQVEYCIKYAFCGIVSSKPDTPQNTGLTPGSRFETTRVEIEKAGEEVDVEMKGDEESPAQTDNPEAVKTEETEKAEAPSADPLLKHLFLDCRLIERVINAWEENESLKEKPGCQRKGYMAHLTRIANFINFNASDPAGVVSSFISQLDEPLREKWFTFINVKLAETNENNKIIPIKTYNTKTVSSSEDEDADFRDVTFPQDASLQQVFADYQLQQMTDTNHESYGYTDDDFIDQDDSSKSLASNSRGLHFGLEDPSSSPTSKTSQIDLFDSYFKSRFSGLPGDFADAKNEVENEDDPWADKTREISFGAGFDKSPGPVTSSSLSPIRQSPNKMIDCSSPPNPDHLECSSNSSSEDDGEEKNSDAKQKMDFEEAHGEDDFWAEEVPANITPVDVEAGNPWDSATPETLSTETKLFGEFGGAPVQPEGAWAAFEDAEMTSVTEGAAQSPAGVMNAGSQSGEPASADSQGTEPTAVSSTISAS